MGFVIAPDGELSTFWTTTSVLEYIFVGDLEERKRENESYRRLLAQPTFSLPFLHHVIIEPISALCE
tara:strand:- start:258 stop:458 length:201 start_codon:yes stop_codon:yes gene_type:complete